MVDPRATPIPPVKPTFEEAYPEIARLIEARRSSWTYVSIVEWQEVAQMLLIRIFNKWDMYDPAKAPKMENWINRVITNVLLNLRRDLVLRLSRPCIGGGKSNGKSCVYNTGGDSCAFTKSGRQCAQCPLYAEWQKKREAQLHIKSNVSLENHAQEVSNIQSDFIDIEAIQDWLHEEMAKELTRWEGKVYRMLMVQHLTPTITSKKLIAASKTRKRALNPSEQCSYQAVLAMKRRFKEMMFDVLRRGGHIQ